jgi:hypothetical protein
MRRQHLVFRPVLLFAFLFVVQAEPLRAAAQGEGSDQFLDGIGETALVARYLLNGNTADSSRNA